MAILSAMSALLLLLGWAALVLGAVVVWSYVAVTLTMSLGWFAGACFMVASLAAFVHFDAYAKAPFLFWLRVWEYADRMIVGSRRMQR